MYYWSDLHEMYYSEFWSNNNMWGDLWRCLYGITWAFINSISVEIFSIFFFKNKKMIKWFRSASRFWTSEGENFLNVHTGTHIFIRGFFSIDK